MKPFIVLMLLLLPCQLVFSNNTTIPPQHSKAGFYELPDCDRKVFRFNVGWRFFKGKAADAHLLEFKSDGWPRTNTPHGLSLHSKKSRTTTTILRKSLTIYK